MGLAKMVESSIGEGYEAIEGGRGHYAYKLQMGGEEWPLRSVQFVVRFTQRPQTAQRIAIVSVSRLAAAPHDGQGQSRHVG